jgi:type IX secretion system PorP/SprF family membrane protein
MIVNYRNQWPSLAANYVTSVVSFDTYFERFNSGLGVVLMNDSQGGSRIKNTEASLLYSYQLQLSDDGFLRLGVQGTYSNRGFDVFGLTFGDQFGTGGFTGNASGDPLADPRSYQNSQIFDASAGVLYYNPKLWLSISSHHLTQPQIDFVTPGTVGNTGGALPRKYTVTGGYNIPLRNPLSNASNSGRELIATPAFLFKQQGKFSQLDVGAYLTYSPVTLGLWYRGIPINKHNTSRVSHDALVALAGFRFDSFSFGYSYDLTVSSLGVSSGGSHEISISYTFDILQPPLPPYKKKRRKELSCPKF